MAKLTPAQIKGYASKAGFKGEDLVIATAVAIAESGGDTEAHNKVPPDDSYGLWQINMLGKMGFNRRNEFLIQKNEELYDPSKNAEAAYKIFKQQGWSRGWTTYKNGAYKKHMDAARGATATDERNGIDNAIGDAVTSPIAGVSSAINSFGSTVFKGVSNLAGIGIALGLLAVGVVLLIVSSKSAQKAVGVAANVVPGGAAVKSTIKKVTK